MSLARTDPEAYEQAQREPLTTRDVLLDTVLTKADRPKAAEVIVNRLREKTDSLTAYVLLKQAKEIIEAATETMADYAGTVMCGSEMEVLGATVKTRSVKEYEYTDPKIFALENQITKLKKQLDDLKKMNRLQQSDIADPATGEIIPPAVLKRDGQTLVVTFK